MMKKLTALLLVFLLLLLTGCRNTEYLRGDVENKDALRVYIDAGYTDDNPRKLIDIDDFMLSVKDSGGLENVVFEVIPSSGVERSAAIARLRTEMMAGGGPDVFITEAGLETDFSKTLFPYPEKVMESGLFLPLDEYMEKNTEFTEWDKQQPVVLAAGRNREGQQIIPLSYTFPVQVCLAANFTMEPREEPITWQDTLTDPALSEVYARFNDCAEISETYRVDLGQWETSKGTRPYFSYILGELADYEKEELLFTEEELYERIQEILPLWENTVYDPLSSFKDDLMGYPFVQKGAPLTFMPMYSDDGGVSVTIKSYAAVNRNTKYPEEAFRVIDVLLRKHTQLTKSLYTDGLCHFTAIPLYDEAFHSDSPFRHFHSFSDESYESFCAVKEQITSAHFYTTLDYDLGMLLYQCLNAENPDDIKYLVHAAYESMQRKVRE